ncbi:TniQ family protein [Pollutimonas subterranea]|uniref:TniQ family protein n=1 Tax=Pollutimonas subterranea TaxID=2045210 RepID=UPI0013041836|nr:TniQ family protein [Pollutimonas subterranea]
MNTFAERADNWENTADSLPFVLRPRPVQGELLDAYLHRLLRVNGYQELRGLVEASPLARTSKLEFLQRHASLQEEELGRLMDPEHVVIEAKEHRKLFLTPRIRWCPKCVVENGIFLANWAYRTTVICVKHRSYLRDECPSCHSPQLARSLPGLCKCGLILTRSEDHAVPEPLYRLQQKLHRSLFCEGSQALFGLTYFKAAKLAHYMGMLACGSGKQSLRESALSCRLFNDRVLMTAAANTLDRWPESFLTLLALNQALPSTQSVRRDFGVVYTVLYRCLRGSEYQFLRDEFEKFVNDHWQGALTKRNKSFSRGTLAKHPRMTLKDATAKSKAAPSVLKRLGTIVAAAEVGTTHGRRITTVETRRLQHIDGVTLQKAAQLLHLQERRIRLLIEAEIIKADISPVIYKAAAWFISLHQLHRLIFHNQGHRAADAVSFTHVMKCGKLTNEEFIGLVKALMTGKIQTVNGSASTIPLGQARVSRVALTEWLQKFRFDNDLPLSVDQAAKALGIKQEVAYFLVRKGLLISCSGRTQGSVQVRQKDLKSFQAKYVSLATLAKKRGTSPKTLRLCLLCDPATGPDVDGGRQYFYRVADLNDKADERIAASARFLMHGNGSTID